MAEAMPVVDFSNCSIFHRFRSRLPTNSEWHQIKMNLLDNSNNMIFLWSPAENLLLTASLKPASEFGGYQEYQTIRPNEIPYQGVQEIKVNPRGSQVALISPYVVTIMDLPSHWEKKEVFQYDRIMNTNRLVPAGQYSQQCPDPTVMKARWYPGPTLEPFIAVLYSDNAIRVYNTDTSLQVQYIKFGRPNRPGLHTRGDMVVDFDFALNTSKLVNQYINKQSIIARSDIVGQQFINKIYVLLRNGDVYTALVDVDPPRNCPWMKNPMVQGPLTMTPRQEDNYGSEVCSLIVLQCFPPVLIIATVSGTIYHMVALPYTLEICNQSTSNFSGSAAISFREPEELKVFESLTLSFNLPVTTAADTIWSSPMQLVKDQTNNMRYFCSNEVGIHLIRMPIIPLLDSFLTASPEREANFWRIIDREPTTVELLICTEVQPTEPQCSNTMPAIPKGLTMITPPDTLLSLFSDGKLITLLIPALTISEEIIVVDSSDTNKRPEQFKTFISNIIKRAQTKNQPILKLSSEPSLLHMHDLLTSAITLFRNDVFHTHKTVIEELERRVRVLSHMKENQREQMKVLYKDRIDLKNTAERLAEKYEEINDKQFEYLRRSEILLLKVQSLHASTTAERRMVTNLKEKQAFLARIVKAVEQIRNRHSYFKEQKTQLEVQDQRMAVFLNNNQSSSIRRNLSHLKLGIMDLVDRVNSAKQQIESDGL